MTSDENTAKALARWLEQPPGTEPPSELGRDVVEAIYALRPDLAPAPRLTADDILAGVRRGPLASAAASPTTAASREGAEIVAFPGESAEWSDPEMEVAPRRTRLWWWVGGTSGVGLALAAAATLALVALPGLKEGQEQAPATVAASPDAEEAPRPAAELRKEVDAVGNEEGKLGARAPAEAEAARGPAASAPPPDVGRTRSDESLYTRGNAAQEMVGLGGAATGMKDEAPAPPIPEIATAASESNTAAPEEDAEKAGAKQKVAAASAAPATIDDDTRDKIDATVERAERVRKKDRKAATEILSEVIAPPADVGQYAAVVAAERSLQEGDADAALEIARQGLALSDLETPERARLEELESAALVQQQAEDSTP